VRWICLAFLMACSSGSAKPEPQPELPKKPEPLADTSAGKAAYTKLCVQCHGADLKGYVADHAPSLINQTFLESATDEYLRASIALGRPGTSMPGYSKSVGGPLDDAQLDGLVAYIRSNGPQAQQLAPTRKGVAARGGTLYAEYCKSCHGDVSVRGEAMHLANAQFQKLASDAFIRYAIEKGRPGTKMLGFGNVLRPQQLDDLVAYIRVLGMSGGTPITPLPAPTGKEPLVINPTGKDPVWKVRANKFVSVDEVAKAYAEKRKMIIIDARPPSDWMQVHIEGAVSIPYHDLKRLDEIPKDVAVIAYCACPHHLSGIVVDELVKRGHKKAYVLDEGINLWRQKNHPVVAAKGLPAPTAEPHNHGHHHGHDHGHHGHGHP
jgi:mono/diheme cytochrome c family protein/rhodanese-related sulfurtransferase